MQINKQGKKLVLLLGIAFVIRCLFLIRPLDMILEQLSDDAFYYYETVKNFVNGNGIAFNIGAETNGFHPLFFILIAPIYIIFAPIGQTAPIYVILLLLNISDLITGYNLFKMLKTKTNEKTGFLGCIIWIFNPFIILTTNLGVEISVQVMIISFIFRFIIEKQYQFKVDYLESNDYLSTFSVKESLILSLLVGLACLGRLDGIFIVAAVALSIYLKHINFYENGIKELNFKKVFSPLLRKQFLSIFVFPIIFLGLWMIWSYSYVGLWFPISATKSYDSFLSNSHITNIMKSIRNYGGFLINFFYYPSTTSLLLKLGIIFIVAGIPILIVLIYDFRHHFRFIKKTLIDYDFAIFWLMLFMFYYCFYRAWVRAWYGHYLNILVVIFLSLFLNRAYEIIVDKKRKNRIIENIKPKIKMIFPVIFVTLVCFNGVMIYLYPYANGRHILKLEVTEYINNNFDDDVVLGSFNTGELQYFTPNHDIINLDGLINPESALALENGDIVDYVISRDINYIIDNAHYLQELNDSASLELTLHKRFQMNYEFEFGTVLTKQMDIYTVSVI